MGHVTMTKERAIQIWRNRTGVLVEDETVDRLPLFSPGKGGRIWLDAYINIEMLEALVVLGREQVPNKEAGVEWWRGLPETEDGSLPKPDHTPMTLNQAREILDNKHNGYFTPFKVAEHEGEEPKVRNTVEVVGEATIEEMEALLLLWRNAQ